MTIKIIEPDQIAGIKLAIEMHQSGKTIAWIRKKMKTILLDDNSRPFEPSFLPHQFALRGYDFKKRERDVRWKRLHSKPDSKRDKDLDHRYERLERVFLEKWKDNTPETAAQGDGFPEGWSKLVGGDEDWYDIYIDRYTKKSLVTVWKDRGEFWWWKPADGSEARQTLSKYEAIAAAEAWLKKLEQE